MPQGTEGANSSDDGSKTNSARRPGYGLHLAAMFGQKPIRQRKRLRHWYRRPPGTVERAGELGQDGEVGVKPNPIQPKRDDFLRDLAKVAQKPEPAKRDGKQP